MIPSGWTIDTLKEVLEVRINDLEEQILALKQEMREQVDLAREGEYKRQEAHETAHAREHAMQVDATNKTERTIRDMLASMEKNQAQQIEAMKETYKEHSLSLQTALTKAEANVDVRFREVESKNAARSDKSEAAVASLRAELLPQITGEQRRGDKDEGRQNQQKVMIALIFSVIAAIGSIIGILVFMASRI